MGQSVVPVLCCHCFVYWNGARFFTCPLLFFFFEYGIGILGFQVFCLGRKVVACSQPRRECSLTEITHEKSDGFSSLNMHGGVLNKAVQHATVCMSV